jgi:hypothetical protein
MADDGRKDEMKTIAITISAISAILLLGSVGCTSTNTTVESNPAESLSKEIIPEGIDIEQTSKDVSYGYTVKNPVKLGGPDEFDGPAMSSVYLRHLRDSQFKPFTFGRDGSFGGGADGHILDRYTLIDSLGKKHQIFIDMYHPENTPLKCNAPKGMYFWK